MKSFLTRLRAVSKAYIPGTMGYVKTLHGGLYEATLNTEAEIERLWLAMREGKDTLEQFREAVGKWEGAYLKAIALYNGGEMEQKGLF